MKLTKAQYERIKEVLPRQRGNVRLSNLDVLNAALYVAEKGCTWRAVPEEFGNWNTIYVRLNRWAKSGVLDRVFETLQRERLLRIRIEAIPPHEPAPAPQPPEDGKAAAPPRPAPADAGEDPQPKFIWLPRMPAPR